MRSSARCALRLSRSPFPLIFGGGLVVKADRLVYRSTLGSRAIKKKKKDAVSADSPPRPVTGYGGIGSSLKVLNALQCPMRSPPIEVPLPPARCEGNMARVRQSKRERDRDLM